MEYIIDKIGCGFGQIEQQRSSVKLKFNSDFLGDILRKQTIKTVK